MRAGSFPAAEVVVEKQTEPEHPARPQMPVVGQNEAQGPDDMGSDLEQSLAFDQCLADEPELVEFEVAQAAVNEFCRRR